MVPLLLVSNLETVYAGRGAALSGVSFALGGGECLAVLGPNGAGKTTLLRTVAGLLKDQPQKGTIELAGQRIAGRAPQAIARQGVAYVPEDGGLFRELSVKENLELGLWGRKGRAAQEGLAFVRDLFPALNEMPERPAEALSGGQQQMLALGRALLRRPRLLLLDEPSRGLAPKTAEALFATLAEILRGGAAILLVEQNPRLALSLAQRGAVLEGGRLVAEGTPAQLKARPDLRSGHVGGGPQKDP